jgi:segregation and condensation protein B
MSSDTRKETEAIEDVPDTLGAPPGDVPAGTGSVGAGSVGAGSSDPAYTIGSSDPVSDTSIAPVVDDQLKAIVEALIFASPEPLTSKMLFKLLEQEPREDVEAAVAALKQDYERPGGLQFVEVAGGYQIVTRPDLHEWVRRLFHERKTQKLSVQALETLAVVAYRQPITGPEIAEIRGVNTAGVLSTLLERHLIKISGRKAIVGRPFLYATTREFLVRFGLKDLNDLPKMEDMAEVLGFEAPAGLADTGPLEPRLPLEVPEASGNGSEQ